MGSSNIASSGRFAGQKSKFNQTCSLLGQYLKENGSLEDLNIGFDRNFETKVAPSKTMNLLPMIEKACQMPEPEKSQLTIFYAGQVLVFNDFPADKIGEIMLMASQKIPLNQLIESPTPPPSFDLKMVHANLSQKTLSTKISDLPIERKHSLTRFLEKRKDRITARAPYKSKDKEVAFSMPAAEYKPWLGLAAATAGAGGARFPLQMNLQK